MDFTVSDLAGLEKPITRLIEVVSAGVGKVAAPYLIASTAAARAKEIQDVAQAIKSVTNNADLDISYEEGKVAIKTVESQKFITEVTTIENRASDRILFEANKQQRCLEQVTSHAAFELSGEESVPEQKPDEDWISRFFDYAKTISTQEMQRLWGKILAGEIKRPGKFSLRTLDTVRNISQQEAEMFVKVAQYGFFVRADAYVPLQIGKYSGDNLLDRSLAALAEAGLLSESPVGFYAPRDANTRLVFEFSNEIGVSVVRDPKVQPRVEMSLNVLRFTNTAKQLMQLIPWQNPPWYVQAFCEEVKKHGWVPTIGTHTNPEMPEFHETPKALTMPYNRTLISTMLIQSKPIEPISTTECGETQYRIN